MNRDRRSHLTTALLIGAGIVLAYAALGILRDIRWLLEAGVWALFGSLSLEPAVDALVRRGWRRKRAAGAVLGVTAAGMLVVVGSMIPAVTRAIGDVIGQRAVLGQEAGKLAARVGLDSGTVTELVNSGLSNIQHLATDTSVGADVAAGVAGGLVTVATAAFLIFYMLSEFDRVERAIVRLLPVGQREVGLKVIDLAVERVGGFLYGNLILAIIAGAFTALICWALGVRTALGMGAWTLVGSLIPVAGGFIGSVLPVAGALVADLAAGQGLWRTAVLVAVFFAFQAADNYWLRPKILSRSVEIHPAVAFLAVVAGASMWGILGALAAVPAVAVGSAFVKEWIDTRPEVDPTSASRVRRTRRTKTNQAGGGGGQKERRH